jgi:hypothetical protein
MVRPTGVHVVVDEIGRVRPVVREVEVREVFADILPIELLEGPEVGAVQGDGQHQGQALGAQQPEDKVDIDDAQAHVHDGGGVGFGQKGKDHEDGRADQIHHPQLQHRGHQKGYQDQQRGEIAHDLQNGFAVHRGSLL